jgi:hypothetical protein
MVLAEERVASSHAQSPTVDTADLRRVLGIGVPVEVPMAHRPGINVRLVPSLRNPPWNAEHGQVMRGMEALLAAGMMAYFGAGLLGVLGVI